MKKKRGDIYYADLSPVVGSEQGGVRPVLILQNNTGNRFGATTIIAPVTSREEKGRQPTQVPVLCKGMKVASTVLLEQIRTIDKQRFRDYVGHVDSVVMEQVDQALAVSLGIKKMIG